MRGTNNKQIEFISSNEYNNVFLSVLFSYSGTIERRARANKTAILKRKKAFIHFHDRIFLAGSGETRERSETVKVL